MKTATWVNLAVSPVIPASNLKIKILAHDSECA